MVACFDFGSIRWERLGSEFRITFLGTEPISTYIQRVLDLVDRTGVDLLHLDTGSHEICDEIHWRRHGTRGFLGRPTAPGTLPTSAARLPGERSRS